MARPKLYHADQPLLVRWILWLYEFCASLKLAVVLIATVAGVLAFATFVEANYGTEGVQWFIYQSPVFLWLLGLLALNIFCAAAIRYPWKRHQTGFVITHIGLLTLLGGSALTYVSSVNSQLLVHQGEQSDVGVDHDEGYLRVELPGRDDVLQYRVNFGPFNWEDQAPSPGWRKLQTALGRDNYPAPWQHPPVRVYADETTQVDIVNYYSRSEVHLVPYLSLDFKQTLQGFQIPIEVEYNRELKFGEKDFGGFGSVMLWRADAAEFQGFTECIPEQSVEGLGTLVVLVDGERYSVPLTKLDGPGNPFDLGEGISVELLRFVPAASRMGLLKGELVAQPRDPRLDEQGGQDDMPVAEFVLRRTGAEGSAPQEFRLIRAAKFPFLRLGVELPAGIAAEYYHPGMAGRIDIVEGPGEKLAYRVWQKALARVVAAGSLEKDKPVSTWSMGGGEAAWQMTLARYIPEGADGAAHQVLPLPFNKDDDTRGSTRRIQVRVTSRVGDQESSREFWLRQNFPRPWPGFDHEQVEDTKLADGSQVRCSFHVKDTPVGFAMRLNAFDLQVDPGAPMASNYTSEVTVFDKREGESDQGGKGEAETAEGQNFIVTMNAPLDYPDPQGRTLRFFQENYIPPRQNQPLASIFRVNYDPGRWVKYLGSLLVCAGIFTMFYMRAYFVKPVRTPAAPADVTAAPRVPHRTAAGV